MVTTVPTWLAAVQVAAAAWAWVQLVLVAVVSVNLSLSKPEPVNVLEIVTVVPVVFGDPPKNRERTKYHETVLLVAPPLALLVILAVVGLWLPPPLFRLVTEAAALLGVPG